MIVHEITETNYKEENYAESYRMNQIFKDYDKDPDPRKLWNPTVWAYSILKDRQNKPLRFLGFQDRLVNNKERFIICAASNQIGKTWSMSVKGIHHALHVPNATVLIVSITEQQAIRVLDEIKWMLMRANIRFDEVIGDVSNRTELHLKVGDGISVITSLPPTKRVLGYAATLIIGDEVAFWEDGLNFYKQILEPRANKTKNWKHKFLTMGQICLVSNPNGQQGIFWDIWKDDSRFQKYRYCWLADQDNTITEYNFHKNNEARSRFDSVYAAEFSSAMGGFITQPEFENCIEKYFPSIDPKKELYIGGDFTGEDTVTRDTDLSVLYGFQKSDNTMTPKVKLVYWIEFPRRTPKKVILEEIRRLSKEYMIGKFAYDKMGVGDSIKAMILEENILSEGQTESLTYSLPNKTEVFTNMKALFEQNRIIIPHDLHTLKEQLLGLRFEQTTGGYLNKPLLKISRDSRKQHDDHADAFANGLFAAIRLSAVVPAGFFV